jgi:hypothetical protein
LKRLVRFEVADIRKSIRRVAEPSKLRGRLRPIWDDGCCGGAGCGYPGSGQEPPAADINFAIAPFHALLPLAFVRKTERKGRAAGGGDLKSH